MMSRRHHPAAAGGAAVLLLVLCTLSSARAQPRGPTREATNTRTASSGRETANSNARNTGIPGRQKERSAPILDHAAVAAEAAEWHAGAAAPAPESSASALESSSSTSGARGSHTSGARGAGDSAAGEGRAGLGPLGNKWLNPLGFTGGSAALSGNIPGIGPAGFSLASAGDLADCVSSGAGLKAALEAEGDAVVVLCASTVETPIQLDLDNREIQLQGRKTVICGAKPGPLAQVAGGTNSIFGLGRDQCVVKWDTTGDDQSKPDMFNVCYGYTPTDAYVLTFVNIKFQGAGIQANPADDSEFANVGDPCYLIAVGCTFENFQNEGGDGGVVKMEGDRNDLGFATFEAVHSIFRNNRAKNGGVLYLDKASTFYCTTCVFDNNEGVQDGGDTQTGSGGAWRMDGDGQGDPPVTQGNQNAFSSCVWCEFTNNQANYKGGVVRASTIGDVALFDHCSFVENTAVQGGALFFRAISTVTASQFLGNLATGDDSAPVSSKGGAIMLDDNSAQLTVVKTVFIDNGASAAVDSDFGAFGGAIYMQDPSISGITGSEFRGNFAKCSGDFTSQVDCFAVGGALYNEGAERGPSTVLVQGTTFTGNEAYLGGALGVRGKEVSIVVINSIFTANSAGGSGGAAFVDKGSLECRNCAFLGNTVEDKTEGALADLFAPMTGTGGAIAVANYDEGQSAGSNTVLAVATLGHVTFLGNMDSTGINDVALQSNSTRPARLVSRGLSTYEGVPCTAWNTPPSITGVPSGSNLEDGQVNCRTKLPGVAPGAGTLFRPRPLHHGIPEANLIAPPAPEAD